MTPAEQNRAIAEWMGWKDVRTCVSFTSGLCGTSPEGSKCAPTPNFHGDLNACWEFEEKLTMIQARSYANSLRDSVDIDSFCGLHATSPKRCEALLRTLGLWKEGE